MRTKDKHTLVRGSSPVNKKPFPWRLTRHKNIKPQLLPQPSFPLVSLNRL